MSKNKKSEVAMSIAELVDLMKIQVKNSIIEKSSELNIDRNNIQKLCMMIDASLTNTFVNGVENILKKVE